MQFRTIHVKWRRSEIVLGVGSAVTEAAARATVKKVMRRLYIVKCELDEMMRE